MTSKSNIINQAAERRWNRFKNETVEWQVEEMEGTLNNDPLLLMASIAAAANHETQAMVRQIGNSIPDETAAQNIKNAFGEAYADLLETVARDVREQIAAGEFLK